jgi:hypothetical protein
MAIVAQLGGGYVVGAGGYFIQFTAPELGRRKPLFLALAAGITVGGSIGSCVGIPWSEVVRRLINPDAVPTPRDDLIFSPLDGSFALRDIQGAQISITQIGGSALVVGAQIVTVDCRAWRLVGRQRIYFVTDHQIPTDLPSLGRALVDTPTIQGGLGIIAHGFIGSLWHIG